MLNKTGHSAPAKVNQTQPPLVELVEKKFEKKTKFDAFVKNVFSGVSKITNPLELTEAQRKTLEEMLRHNEDANAVLDIMEERQRNSSEDQFREAASDLDYYLQILQRKSRLSVLNLIEEKKAEYLESLSPSDRAKLILTKPEIIGELNEKVFHGENKVTIENFLNRYISAPEIDAYCQGLINELGTKKIGGDFKFLSTRHICTEQMTLLMKELEKDEFVDKTVVVPLHAKDHFVTLVAHNNEIFLFDSLTPKKGSEGSSVIRLASDTIKNVLVDKTSYKVRLLGLRLQEEGDNSCGTFPPRILKYLIGNIDVQKPILIKLADFASVVRKQSPEQKANTNLEFRESMGEAVIKAFKKF